MRYLKAKKDKSDANASDIEEQIDNMVYKLYRLSPRDNGIMEGLR